MILRNLVAVYPTVSIQLHGQAEVQILLQDIILAMIFIMLQILQAIVQLQVIPLH